MELQRSTNSLCIKGMEDFVEHVKSDQDKFVPKDGTVHQLTSNVSAEFDLEKILVGWCNDHCFSILGPDFLGAIDGRQGLFIFGSQWGN